MQHNLIWMVQAGAVAVTVLEIFSWHPLDLLVQDFIDERE